MKSLIKNQKGAILPLVLITLVVLSIFTVTAISLNTTNFKVADVEADRARAYYIARTGADAFSQYIVKNPDSKSNLKEFMKNIKDTPSNSTKFGGGEFNIKVEELKYGYKINSIGKFDNTEETVGVNLVPDGIDNVFEERVLLSTSKGKSMEIGKYNGNVKINGLVQSNGEIEFKGGESDRKKTEYKENAQITNLKTPVLPKNDYSYIKQAYDESLIKYDKSSVSSNNSYMGSGTKTIETTDDYKSIQVTNSGELKVQNLQNKEDIKLRVKDDIQISNGGTLDIKTLENQTIEIYASEIKLGESSTLNIIGKGTVKIILNEELQIGDKSNINIEENSSVYIQAKKIEIGDGCNTKILNNNSIKLLATGGDIQIGKDKNSKNSSLIIENNKEVEFIAPEGDIEIEDKCTVTINKVDKAVFYAKEIELGDAIGLNISESKDIKFIATYGDIQIGEEDNNKSSQLDFKNVNNLEFIALKGEIEIEDKAIIKSSGISDIYFQGKEIEIGKNVDLLAKDYSRFYFFLKGVKDADDEGEFEIDEGSTLKTEGVDKNGKDTSHIFVIVEGDGEIEIEKGVEFHGYIYAPNAELEISENVKLEGSFIGKEVEIGTKPNMTHKYPKADDLINLDNIINLSNTYKILGWGE